MKNKLLIHILFMLIGLAPLLYLWYIWNTLPATVPIHFGGDMKPDSFGPRSELIGTACVISGISIITYLLMQNIHRIDPKRRHKPNASIFNKLGAGIILFLAALNILTLMASAGKPGILSHGLLPVVGLLFTFLGNYMYSVKPNYFAGIRTPWALSNDYNWTKTHQLAGILWFIGGLVITISALILPAESMEYILIPVIAILAVVPYAYSFIIYKRQSSQLDKEI
ncbi:MAG: SdpI family protein [Taibaiella sp.]|nr:SdpI family protein [Taibaiella sp.]